MNEKITNDELKNLGVYELRELARNMGVLSPTTKKRAQLIDEIIKITCGEQEAILPKKQGRPPKSLRKFSSIIASFIPEDIVNLSKDCNKEEDAPEFTQFFTLSQEIKGFPDKENSSVISGYLKHIGQNNYYISYYDVDTFLNIFVYIPIEIINKYSLRIGDKIVGIAYQLKDKTCSLFKKIISINGVEATKFVRKNIDLSNYLLPTKDIELFGNKIKQGERYFSICKDKIETIQSIIDFIDKDSQSKFVFYGLDLPPEIIHFARTREKIELFVTHFADEIKDSYEKTTNCINFCSTYLKDGHDVILINFDMLSTEKALDTYYSRENNISYQENNVESIKQIKKVIGLGSNYNGASLTSISIFFEESTLFHELSNLYKGKIAL